jgi:NADH:ubiquinone reductase (H+-translocating)
LQERNNSGLPHVVIVGGGFAGLYAAKGLRKAPVQITLLDRHNYHLFRPMTYQVATGLLSGDEIAAPLRSIFRDQKNVDVLMAEVTGIDTQQKLIHLGDRELHYDFLIVATGIQYNYFGHEDWKHLAPGLDSIDDADRIRGKILSAFEAAENMAAIGGASPEAIQRLLTFVIVGGGTAGVEMAGTIAELARLALARDFRHIDPDSARILLYEAMPRILGSYPDKLSQKATAHLEQLGVTVHTNSKVQQVDLDGITVNDTRVPSHTILWCAGVLASPAGKWLGAETDRSGRVRVDANLSIPGHSDVFAIGDTALVVAQSRNLFGFKAGKPAQMPGVAQPAIQEGKYVADLIRRRLADEAAPAPFWYWDKGDLAIVGRTFAIADFRFLSFSGFVAWVIWAGVHIYFLIGFANRLLVSLRWAMSFITNRRTVRIFPLVPDVVGSGDVSQIEPVSPDQSKASSKVA